MNKTQSKHIRRSRRTKRTKRTKSYHKSRRTQRTQRHRGIRHHRGGACSGGEYALVQGIQIQPATTVNSSFTGVSIADQMAKFYTPTESPNTMPTIPPNPFNSGRL